MFLGNEVICTTPLSHRTKKAPRRNEGLSFKALKKLNEVNLPNWLDVIDLAFAA